jgi:hypothetical protein
MSLRQFASRPALQHIALALLLSGAAAYGQYGVSPSVTGMFFNDLRYRATENAADTGAVNGDYVYDYSQGAYVGPDGAAATTDGVSAGASQGNPLMAAGNGYTNFSQRQAGDYTQYSGPYSASSGFFAPPFTSDPYLGGKRNLRIGGVNLGFGLSAFSEYNSNVTRSGTNPVSDVIVGSYLNISANYQLTRRNNLTLSTVVGFDRLIDHPEAGPYGNNGFLLNVLPGSTLALDGKIGPVYVVVYDRVSVRPATNNDFVLSDAQIFGVVQNDIGLAAQWDINSSLSLALNYMHSDAIALEDSADIYSRSTDSVHATLAWSPDGTWTLGAEGGTTWVRYPESFNNGGLLANIGAFFSMPVGKSTQFRVAGGYQDFSFDRVSGVSTQTDLNRANDELAAANAALSAAESAQALVTTDDPTTPENEVDIAADAVLAAQERVTAAQTTQAATSNSFNSSNQDNSDLSDYYFNAVVTNRLSSRVIQALSFGHESALNTTSNYITADYVSYGLGIVAWRGARLNIAGYFESSEESGGRLQEEIEQKGVDVYLSHQVNSKLRLGLGYHHGLVDSNLANRSYTQNVINVDATYALSRKMSVQLGYRFFTTSADVAEFNFDQHRVMMSVNYNF